MQARSGTASKISASFITLEEGFQQFGNDLNKLQVGVNRHSWLMARLMTSQQFIELNATAFSKILKKVGNKLCDGISLWYMLTADSGTKPQRSAVLNFPSLSFD